MRPFYWIVLTVFFILSVHEIHAQNYVNSKGASSIPIQRNEYSVFSTYTKYLAKGDVESLSTWFSDNIDVSIGNIQKNCSKTQAKQILKSFYDSYTPRSLQIIHKVSESNRKYMIGVLNAGGEVFQVTVYAVLSADDSYKINQLSITLQE